MTKEMIKLRPDEQRVVIIAMLEQLLKKNDVQVTARSKGIIFRTLTVTITHIEKEDK
jgi:hypothetical protein